MDELETELEVFEAPGTEIADRNTFGLSLFRDTDGGGIREADRDAVGFGESLGEFMDDCAADLDTFPFSFFQKQLKLFFRTQDDVACNDKALQIGAGQLEFVLAENAFADSHQTARAGFLQRGQPGYFVQGFILEKDFDAVSAKGLLILADDAALGGLEDLV